VKATKSENKQGTRFQVSHFTLALSSGTREAVTFHLFDYLLSFFLSKSKFTSGALSVPGADWKYCFSL